MAGTGPANTPITTVQFTQETPEQRVVTGSRLARVSPWRSARRHTPFAKTPATRNLRSVKRPGTQKGPRTRTPPGGQPVQAVANHNTLQELVGKTWHVHRLSPLYRFSHKTSDLRHYSRVLSAYLQAESHKGLAVDTNEDRADAATFTVMKGLRKSNAEAEAIQVQLKQKPKQGNGEARVVGVAVLCSVGASDDSVQKVAEPFTLLPVMLYRGPITLSRHLSHWLQTQFDCAIHPVIFSPISMSWMVAMWAGSTLTEKKGNSVHLQYKVPVDGLDYITLDIDPKDCKVLWQCIHQNVDDSFHCDEVETFIKALEQHFYRHFKINIGSMPLYKVGTSVACVGAEGKLKMFSEDYLHQILGHVTEVILETNSSNF